jgi:hypothetical protein
MWMLGLAILVGAVVLATAMRSSVDDGTTEAEHCDEATPVDLGAAVPAA